MRRGGSGSGVAGAGLTGGGAAGLAVAIDAVRVGAASSTNAGTGTETGPELTGAGAAGLAVAINAVRVGASSSTSDSVLRRWWTRTPAASAARSVIGTMSVDFIVMGIHRHRETVVDLAERVLTMCFTPHLACANSDAAVSRLLRNSNMDPRTGSRASMECKPWQAILIASQL
jgi:hypothetical protein